MASKRPFSREEEEEEGSGTLVPSPKRTRLWNLCCNEVTSYRFLENFIFQLEPLLRRVVRDEVQKLLLNYADPSPRPSISQIQEAAKFQLYFQNRLPRTLFTGKGIKSEDKMPIRIAIKDVKNEIVTSGPLSSLKIKIVVINSEFGSDEQATWGRQEFSTHIVSERDGKRPLLAGELNIKMHNGVGCLVDASFTDNSSWTRSGKFRLGAVVSESRYTGERVQEAITEAFKVKDGRVEASQKDLPPALDDEVCRLKSIQKDGAFHKKLMDNGIKTVQDFLRAHTLDPRKLRALLGSGMSNKWWEATLKHSLQCAIGDKLYSYCIVGKGIVLVFNSIFHLLGVIVCGNYHPVDNLPPFLKDEVNLYKHLAYGNPGDIVELHDSPVGSHLPAMNVTSVPRSSLSDLHSHHPATLHDASSSQVGFQHQAYTLCCEISSDIPQPTFHTLQQFASFQKAGSSRHSRDKCSNLSVPGPRTYLALNAQATHHDLSFAINEFSGNAVNMQNQGDQSHARKDSSEELNIWLNEILLSPNIDTCTSFAPSSPRKWVKLSALFKLVSVSERFAGRRARIAHPSHQAVAMRV